MNLKDGRWFVFSVLILGFYYLSYRYAFGINSSLTSPTYIDTPAFLMYGKYLFFLFISIYVLLKLNCKSLIHFNYLMIYTCLTFISIFIFAIFVQNIYLIESVIFFPLIFIGYLFSKKEWFWALNFSFLRWTFVLYLTYQFIQFFLFIFYSKLPALGYDNSLSVRFGSFLDDPNGFAVLLSLLLFVPFMFESLFKAYLLFLLSLFALILTQSLTGIATTSFALLMLFLVNGVFKYKSLFKIFSLLAITTLCSGLLVTLIFWDEMFLLLELKQNSIDEHLESFSLLKDWSEFFIPSETNQVGESGIVNFISMMGLLFLPYLVLNIYLILRCIQLVRTAVSPRKRYLFSGIFMFLLSYNLAMFNLPVSVVFPLNYFYFYLVGMILVSGDLYYGKK